MDIVITIDLYTCENLYKCCYLFLLDVMFWCSSINSCTVVHCQSVSHPILCFSVTLISSVVASWLYFLCKVCLPKKQIVFGPLLVLYLPHNIRFKAERTTSAAHNANVKAESDWLCNCWWLHVCVSQNLCVTSLTDLCHDQ